MDRRLELCRLGVDMKSIRIPSKNLERVLVSFQVLLYIPPLFLEMSIIETDFGNLAISVPQYIGRAACPIDQLLHM